jgi:hypothetical protein
MGEKRLPRKKKICTKRLVGLNINLLIDRDLIDIYILTTNLPIMLFVNKKQTTLIVKMTCNLPPKRHLRHLFKTKW